MSTKATPAQAAEWIKKQSRVRPQLAIVLGSGFQGLLPLLRTDQALHFHRLPGFARPSVRGHPGRLLLGWLESVPLLVLGGRVHFYEGHPLDAVTFPIRVLAELGMKTVLLTNAAGGIARRLREGGLMLIEDHLNFMGVNPLRSKAPCRRQRFVDLTTVYDPELRQLLRKAAKQAGVRISAGVYAAVSGPSYETPAEIRAFRVLGADAVGMSTVPEAIVARQCGLRVAGISCITNRAAGLSGRTLSHEEVLAAGKRAEGAATELLRNFVKLYAAET